MAQRVRHFDAGMRTGLRTPAPTERQVGVLGGGSLESALASPTLEAIQSSKSM